MTSKSGFVAAFVAVLGLAVTARSDVWDNAFFNDNDLSTTSSLITHGLSQVHDLGVQPGPVEDQDWYRIVQEPFSSYEILCDGFTGDVPAVDMLHRLDGVGNVLQTGTFYGSASAGPGFALSLRFANDTSTANAAEFVRLSNAACEIFCTTEAQYRIRACDTTIAVPRYNNSGGQVTVLIIQNPGELTVSGNARLWPASGGNTPVTTVAFTLQARQAAVVNLATVNGGVANGTSGTITISNNGRYGMLAVKAVALEPATGFSFDSPGLYKPVS